MDYVKLMKKLKKRGWSQYRIAKETGIGQSTLSLLANGDTRDPRVSTHNILISLLEESEISDKDSLSKKKMHL